MTEPVLCRSDHEAWAIWQRTALVHSKTVLHRRRVDRARDAFNRAMDATDGDLALMWSAGKDSTAMVHLARVGMGLELACYSVRDDLDYPGEDVYIEALADQWGLDLTVVRPPMSAAAWVRERAAAGELGVEDDIHSIDHCMAQELFDIPLEAVSGHHRCVVLGLRAGESRGRLMNRRLRGDLYRLKSGRWRSLPLSDWRGIDVYAYCAAHDVELLPLYQCIGFNHTDEPWRLREDWWLPGAHGRWGHVAWLRRYYPSLYRRLCEWWPEASRLT